MPYNQCLTASLRGGLFFKIMSEEQIKEMAKEYTKQYLSRFKKVAEKAYIDGMLDALKVIKEKLQEL